MDDLEYRWKVENASWDAALSLVDYKGNMTEEFDEALKKFIKRKACKGVAQEYCKEKLQSAIHVAQCSIKFMRTKTGSLPPKPTRRYEILLNLAQVLEAECPEADASLHMTGCRYVELHWDR
jgi:hypothetical protein